MGKTKSKVKKKKRRAQEKAAANGTPNKKKIKTPNYYGVITDPSKVC